MQRDDQRNTDQKNTEEPKPLSPLQEIVETSPPEGDVEAGDSVVTPKPTPLPAEDEPLEAESVRDELAALDDAGEAPADADNETPDSVVEPAAADAEFDEPDVPLAPTVVESTPVSSGGDSGEAAATAKPNRPYFGPITRLDELPPHMLQHLDEKSAANLKAVLDNPDQFDPGILDPTSIQGQYQAFPRVAGSGDDYEAPWYHQPLPPLRLELVLLKYDWIIEEVIDRAARRIDRVTDGKLDSRLNGLLFTIRNEIRSALR